MDNKFSQDRVLPILHYPLVINSYRQDLRPKRKSADVFFRKKSADRVNLPAVQNQPKLEFEF